LPAPETDFPVVTNLSRFCIYDMSAHMGWPCPSNGLFGGCDEFFDDWRAGRTHPYVLRVAGELAGFAATKPMEGVNHFSIQEFFVLAKFRRKGTGRHVAWDLFSSYPGRWGIEQLMGNMPAIHFWRMVVAAYTGAATPNTCGSRRGGLRT
jgi:predicted acetyltransferase